MTAARPVAKNNFSKFLGPNLPPNQSVQPTADGWIQQMKTAIRTSELLLKRLQLPAEDCAIAEKRFPVFVPESFLNRMQLGVRNDPLLLQVLPEKAEDSVVTGWTSDPVGDSAARKAPGLLQKYDGRALLITTGACAIHCRYCFRREYAYSDEPKATADWAPALDVIRQDRTLQEVILSGGDPLTLTDEKLLWLCKSLDQIDHVQRIRFHTRLPIVLPDRMTTPLLQHLHDLRCQVIWVVHANHPHEIAADCREALGRLVQHGFPVLNQAVLLKNINDNPEVLKRLCERLVNIGVMPYYLSLLDKVAGASHYEVPQQIALDIIDQLHAMLPGYAVPRLVREIPGALGKTPVTK